MPGLTKSKDNKSYISNNESYVLERILMIEPKDNFDYNKILLFLSL